MPQVICKRSVKVMGSGLKGRHCGPKMEQRKLSGAAGVERGMELVTSWFNILLPDGLRAGV